MTTAIGVVITEHIVAGKLEDQRLAGSPPLPRRPRRARGPHRPSRQRAGRRSPAGSSRSLSRHRARRRHRRRRSRHCPPRRRRGLAQSDPDQRHAPRRRTHQRPRRPKASPRRSTSPTTPTPSPPASPPPAASSTSSPASGPSATASATAAGPMLKASGRAVTSPSRSIPKEHFCGCGGVGHLEGIMGYRAMRMRFLDLEPEEVFAHAKRATSAAANSSIYGTAPSPPPPPRSFTSPARAVSTSPATTSASSSCRCCARHLETMVKMSPLQSFSLEVLPHDDETALLGAGVSAIRALAS